MCLSEGDVVENEVQDIERSQVMYCFEAIVGLGIFLGDDHDVLKGEVLAVGVSASGRNTGCLKF